MVYTSLFFVITYYAISCQIYAAEFFTKIENTENEFDVCKRAHFIEQENLRTTSLPSSSLYGKWVSQECEKRSGLQYLLRSYTFFSNHTFNLVQIFYKDKHCSSPRYGISALGYFNSNWPAVNYYLTRVTIVVHDIGEARDLSRHVNNACPNTTEKYWKPHIEYELLNRQNKKDRNARSRNVAKNNNFGNRLQTESAQIYDKRTEYAEVDPHCLLLSLGISFDELITMKMYRRSVRNNIKDELFLGKTHSAYDQGRRARSNSFQLPLVLYNKSHLCPICNEIATSSHMFVPILHQQLELPLLQEHLQGEWISERCEPVPLDRPDRVEGVFELFMMKIFRINSDLGQWELQTRYYSEASCVKLLAEQQSYGAYYMDANPSSTPASTVINFETEKSFLVVWDSPLLRKIQSDVFCGRAHYWEIGMKKELSSPCSKIRFGSMIPQNIMQMDYDDRGNDLLYLGEKDADFGAFDYPLTHCSSRAILRFADSSTSATASSFLIIFATIILFET